MWNMIVDYLLTIHDRLFWHVGEFVRGTGQTRKDMMQEQSDARHVMHICLHKIYCVRAVILHSEQRGNQKKQTKMFLFVIFRCMFN